MRPLQPGQTFGPFRIESLLGQGGMGAVYKALDPSGRPVALKLIIVDASDDNFVERFRREARLAAAVRHPNIIAIHSGGDVQGVPYLVFELVEGGSLKDVAKKHGGKAPWREAVALCEQVARGLAAIHGAGLVHRDLKPANVLLDLEGRAKISDFGLARRVGGAESRALTKTGEVLGTLEFMAPEQLDGAKSVDGRADIYALGMTLYDLLTGDIAFTGSGVELMKKQLTDRPDRVSSRAPGIPAKLDDLVDRMLEKDPAKRPATSAAVAGELASILKDPGPVARVRRSPGLVIALALVALAAIGAVAWVKLRAGAEPPVTTTTKPLAPSSGPSQPAAAPVRPSLERLKIEPKDALKVVDVHGSWAWKHGDSLSCVAAFADGKRVVGAGGILPPIVWDVATERELQFPPFPGQRRIYGIAASPDGKKLLAVGTTQEKGSKPWLALWEEGGGDPYEGRLEGAPLAGVAWLPNDDWMIASRSGIVIWSRVGGGQRTQSLVTVPIACVNDGDEYLSRALFCPLVDVPGGVVYARDDGWIERHEYVGSPPSERKTAKITQAPAGSIDALAARGEKVLYAIGSELVLVSGGKTSRLDVKEKVLSVALDERNGAVAGTKQGKVIFVDLDPLKQRAEPIAAHTDRVVAISVAGGRAFTVSDEGALGVFDIATATDLRKMPDHRALIRSLAVRGDTFVTESIDHTIRAWRGGKSELIGSHEGRVMTVGLSLDGKRVYSWSDDEELRAWNVAGGRIAKAKPAGGFSSIAFSPTDPSMILIGGQANGRIWRTDPDLTRFEPFLEIQGEDFVPALAFARLPAERIAAIGFRHQMRVWEWNGVTWAPFQPQAVKGPGTSVALARDGKWVLAGEATGDLEYLPADAKGKWAELKGHSLAINTVDVIEDGAASLAVSASEWDGKVKVWSVRSDNPVPLATLDLSRAADSATSARFVAMNKLLVSTARGVVLELELDAGKKPR